MLASCYHCGNSCGGKRWKTWLTWQDTDLGEYWSLSGRSFQPHPQETGPTLHICIPTELLVQLDIDLWLSQLCACQCKTWYNEQGHENWVKSLAVFESAVWELAPLTLPAPPGERGPARPSAVAVPGACGALPTCFRVCEHHIPV